MKRIITYLAAMTALVLTVSCSRESLQDTSVAGDAISIQVMWSEIATRSAGVDNENAVNSLDWYFYKDTLAASVFHYRESISETTSQKYIRDFIPGEEYGGKTFPRHADLCARDGFCTVFVVANLPSDKVLESPVLATLKAVEVDATFLDGNSPLAPDATALNFIMTGQARVKGTTKLEDATPEVIGLNRLAAKITYDVNVLKSKSVSLDDGVTETWTPMLGDKNVRMYPQNVVKNAVVGAVDELYPASPVMKDADQLIVSSDEPSKWEESGNYYVTKKAIGPYYTYPNNWKNGGSDTFIKIIVPWQVTRTDNNGNVTYSAQREVYYKVLLPEPMILSNTWYQLDITLEPGTENEPEVEVNAKYIVVDWFTGGENSVNKVLKDIKYLIVDYSDATGYDLDGNGKIEGDETKAFVLYGETMSVPYNASNAVGYKVLNAYYTDLSQSTGPAKKYFVTNGSKTYSVPRSGKLVGYKKADGTWGTTISTNNMNDVNSWFTVGKAVDVLTINHALCSVLPTSSNRYFDATPYVFEVRVYLQRAQDEFYKDVTIVQFPQTIAEAQLSTEKGHDSDAEWGHIFINGNSINSDNYNQNTNTPWDWITVITSRSSSNHNPYMYILTTGVLSDKKKVIGDPRTDSYSSGPKSPIDGHTVTFINAPATDGTTRSLKWYYSADQTKSPTFIAPKLRIQSAFGRRGSNNGSTDWYYSWESAWNRCASYQEDGYPAGRWRLPTEAEIEYINTLSTQGWIPSLFFGTNYWSATEGVAYNQGSPVTVSEGSTRCVYDDWYWGSEPVSGAQTVFTWGDKQK